METTSSDPAGNSGTHKVQSVERAIALLEAVAAAGSEGCPLPLLAKRCGLNRATAWRILTTLEDHGLVDRNPDSALYRIGFTTARLAAEAGVDGFIRRTHRLLQGLTDATGETTNLAVSRTAGLTYVDEVAPHNVLTARWLGLTAPLHATSAGKALLAWLPDEEVNSLLGNSLTRYTDSTIVTLDGLKEELRATRTRGYAICVGEVEQSLYGVAAPVFGAGTKPVAVVSIWGTDRTVTADRLPELGRLVVAAAAEFAAAI